MIAALVGGFCSLTDFVESTKKRPMISHKPQVDGYSVADFLCGKAPAWHLTTSDAERDNRKWLKYPLAVSMLFMLFPVLFPAEPIRVLSPARLSSLRPVA